MVLSLASQPEILTSAQHTALQHGDILIQTRSHSAWGGAVTARMQLPLSPAIVWQQVTDYPQWVNYFPDLTASEVLSKSASRKRLYQAARKSFLMLSIQVEIFLSVSEIIHADRWQIHFALEQGSFSDFAAQLTLQPLQSGTLLTYAVQATPNLPVPTPFIQEAMRLDLPANMRSMRRVIQQLAQAR